MNQPTSLYLASLLEVEWQKPEEFEFPNEFAKHWLEEQGSLSRRLKQHCQELTVELLQNHIVTAKTLKSDESQLLSEQDCLLREVVLCGDDCPWVVGRTLIPRTTLVDQQYDLAQQGDIPLGSPSLAPIMSSATRSKWVGFTCLKAVFSHDAQGCG